MTSLKAKTAALVYPNIAGITEGAAALNKGLTAAGVKVKKVGYAQGQTDLIGPLTAAGAQSADIVIPYSDASGCVNQAKALKQLGITDSKKIVSAPLCLNPTGPGRASAATTRSGPTRSRARCTATRPTPACRRT